MPCPVESSSRLDVARRSRRNAAARRNFVDDEQIHLRNRLTDLLGFPILGRIVPLPDRLSVLEADDDNPTAKRMIAQFSRPMTGMGLLATGLLGAVVAGGLGWLLYDKEDEDTGGE